MLDITKTNAAIDTAITELNSVTDGAFKARNVNGLRSLTLAAQNLETAQKHIAKAAVQSAPKAAAQVAAPESQAGPAAGKGKK